MTDEPSLAADGQASHDGSVWTPRRRELLRWFQDEAHSLADPFRGAVELLGMPGFPGRSHFIAHAVRDICNRLPDVLGSVQRERLEYEKEVEALAGVWPKVDLASKELYSKEDQPNPPDLTVSVPVVAASAVDGLIRRHRSRQTHRQITEDMFVMVARADQAERCLLEPIVSEFHRIASWFMGKTHLTNEPVPPPEETELQSKFEQFEGIVSSLVRGFFTTAGELNDILQQANARTD